MAHAGCQHHRLPVNSMSHSSHCTGACSPAFCGAISIYTSTASATRQPSGKIVLQGMAAHRKQAAPSPVRHQMSLQQLYIRRCYHSGRWNRKSRPLQAEPTPNLITPASCSRDRRRVLQPAQLPRLQLGSQEPDRTAFTTPLLITKSPQDRARSSLACLHLNCCIASTSAWLTARQPGHCQVQLAPGRCSRPDNASSPAAAC